jgi:hypothetical protein
MDHLFGSACYESVNCADKHVTFGHPPGDFDRSHERDDDAIRVERHRNLTTAISRRRHVADYSDVIRSEPFGHACTIVGAPGACPPA